MYLHRHVVTHHMCLLSDLPDIINITLHTYIYKAQLPNLRITRDCAKLINLVYN